MTDKIDGGITRNILRCSLGLILLPALLACGKNTAAQPDPLPGDTVFNAVYHVDQLPVSGLFYLLDTAWLKEGKLKELSGLVHSSEKNNASFWGEEDSGNKNAIYLLDTLGNMLGAKYLTGVFNIDWEDMAGGPGPEAGKYYLYVGNTGDNLKIFPFITVYRFVEPAPDPKAWKDSLIRQFDAINLVYPDGAHNAEALMVDPKTKDIYIITKDNLAGLYVARYPQNIHEATRLTKLGTFPVSTVTAADISPGGGGILVKNYKAVFYWTRRPGESITQSLQREPQKLDYHPEPQGEAIAWSYSGKGFYTISEKAGNRVPILFHYASH